MINKWKRQGLRERVEMLRGQDRLIVINQMVGLISKKIVGSKRGFIIKFLPISLRLGIIGCLTLSVKSEGVLDTNQEANLWNVWLEAI